MQRSEKTQGDGQPPRDDSARWEVNGKRVVDEKGQRRKERLYFYSYREHMSLVAQTGLITSLRPSPSSAYDGRFLSSLIESDLEQGIAVEAVAAGRGYDHRESLEFLEGKGIGPATDLNSYRTKRRDKNKEIWVKLKESPSCRRGIQEQGNIEGKFG